MNCYNHSLQPAVAQCPDCGKGLCSGCATSYSIPICSSCNKKRINSEKEMIIKELLLTFGLGILLAVLFVGWTNAGHSYPLVHNILTYALFIYIFSGIVPGWQTLAKITSTVFLFLPFIGWILYVIVKLLPSLCVGIVMLPVRTIRNIRKLVWLQKIHT